MNRTPLLQLLIVLGILAVLVGTMYTGISAMVEKIDQLHERSL